MHFSQAKLLQEHVLYRAFAQDDRSARGAAFPRFAQNGVSLTPAYDNK